MARTVKRYPGKREQLPSAMFLCEGEVTEIEYFDYIRSELCIPKERARFVKSKCNYPAGMISDAISQRRDNERKAKKGDVSLIEHWWVILDTECKPREIISEINRAKKNHINLAVTDPCFEFWLLLHFEYTTRQYCSPEEVIADLKPFLQNYDRANKHCEMPLIYPYLSTAMSNARLLRKNHTEQGFEQPMTDCDLLIDALIEMSEKKDCIFQTSPFCERELWMWRSE